MPVIFSICVHARSYEQRANPSSQLHHQITHIKEITLTSISKKNYIIFVNIFRSIYILIVESRVPDAYAKL